MKQIELKGAWQGALFGLFDPGREAKRILNRTNYGEMFAYLFRRFGYPINGWDDYKQLVVYELSTSMPGVLLSVKPHNGPQHCFGYMLRKDIYAKCREESYRPVRQWNRKFKKWCRNKYRTNVFDNLFMLPTKKELEVTGDAWMNKYHPEITEQQQVTEKIRTEFWEYKEQEYNRLKKRYCQIEPRFYSVNVWDWRDLPEGSLIKQCNIALCQAIEELKRPVNIRDMYINISGKVSLDDMELKPDPDFPDENIPDSVSYSDQAGYGLAYFQ